MRPLTRLAAALLLGTWGVGCATVPCPRLEIVVAKKDQITRVQFESGGFRTTETGRVEDVTRLTPRRESWVRAADQTWYRVSPRPMSE
jgi:hypothetical protein